MTPLRLTSRLLLVAAALPLFATSASAVTLDIYVLTGQSNSLGTILNSKLTNDVAVGSHPAEQGASSVPFWYDNFNGYKNAADAALGASTAYGPVALQPKGGYTYDFLGPELGFARAMKESGATNFGIVKASRDGGGNTNWVSTSTPPADGTGSGAGTAYWKVVDTITAATQSGALAAAGYDGWQIKGLMYLQGESNNATEAAAAATRIQTLVSDLQAQFAGKFAGDFKTVLGENLNTASFNTYGTGGWGGASGLSSNAGITNTNLKALADGSTEYNWAKTGDLSITNTDGLKIHADANSELTIGERFAYAFTHADATANNWTGATSASWANSANWSGATTPDANAIVTLSGTSANLTQTLDGSHSVSGLAFAANTTGAVTINAGTGGTLTVGIGGIDMVNLSGANALTINADVAVGTQDQTWTVLSTSANADLAINGALSGSATITKNGAGVLYLGSTAGSPSTFSGKFAVSAGFLVLDGAGAAGGRPDVALSGTGALVLGDAFGGGVATLGNLTGTSGTGVNTGWETSTTTRTLSVRQTADGTFAGVMATSGSRTLALNKEGSATLTLSGLNTYTGGTTINGGTLIVGVSSTLTTNGALGTGAVTVNSGGVLNTGLAGTDYLLRNTLTVNSGGVLKGSGLLSGALTFNSGAVVAPGNSVDTLTVSGGATFESGSIYEWELQGAAPSLAGTDFDALVVTGGTLTVNSGATLKITSLGLDYTGAFWDTSRDFTYATQTGGTITGSAFTLDTSAAGAFATQGSWSLSTAGNGDLVAQWTAIPEPSTYGLLGVGALVAAALAKRRRKQAP